MPVNLLLLYHIGIYEIPKSRTKQSPIAEHGFSVVIEISYDNNEIKKTKKHNRRYLFDTGVSENGIIHNADLFGINLTTIEAIILSHGPMDHCRGLVNVL